MAEEGITLDKKENEEIEAVVNRWAAEAEKIKRQQIGKAMTFAEIQKAKGREPEPSESDSNLFEIKKADEDQRLIFGWASVAIRKDGQQVLDHQKDMIDLEDLEKAAYDYVLDFRDTGELHDPKMRKKGRLVESVVFTVEKMQAMGIPEGILPEAGWWVGFKVDDEEAWDKIKKGVYSMFSIEGKALRVPVDDSE